MKIISKNDFEIIKNHKDGSSDKIKVLNFLNIENVKKIIHKVEYKDFVIVFFDTKDHTTENVELLFKTINNFYLINECKKNKIRIKVNKFNNTVLLDILKLYEYNKKWRCIDRSFLNYFLKSFKIEEILTNNDYVYLVRNFN